jgi:hypothetical protein
MAGGVDTGLFTAVRFASTITIGMSITVRVSLTTSL